MDLDRRTRSSVASALGLRRFALTRWPWRALLFVVSTGITLVVLAGPLMLMGLPALVAVSELVDGQMSWIAATVLVLLSAVLTVVFLPLVAELVVIADRARAQLIDARRMPETAPAPREPVAWLRDRYASPARWRQAAYVVVMFPLMSTALLLVMALGLIGGVLLAAPVIVAADAGPIAVGGWQVDSAWPSVAAALVGLMLLIGAMYAWSVASVVQVAVLRFILSLGGAAELESRLVEVSRSRARLVDSFDAERQRIERDLHDGAQQRLVTLTMQLGLSKMEVESALGTEHSATQTVSAAHDQAKELMTDLRQFIRGVHPKVLSDIGLEAALDQLAAQAPLPVALSYGLTTRVPQHVESTAYFVVAEALTNVARHSDARGARIDVTHDGHALWVDVSDDGQGGADPRNGTGLTGMADRLAVLDGTLRVSSPVGGPTLIRVRIPSRLEET
ncbi:hypothetical protein VV02_24370 [Luteipulveratus mongoliensis]|uniref:histidine kinase n=1 Tax=Luteipulveratus mongoliensis TaxID=571913 RepID=A0A0K1JNU3_9MICO|nr:hypothetical protein VV02_24370 [Luteipulveratus mongoliensis]